MLKKFKDCDYFKKLTLISVVNLSLLAERSSAGLKTHSGCLEISAEPDNNFFAACRPPKQPSESVSEDEDELELLSFFLLDFLRFFFLFFFFDFLGL